MTKTWESAGKLMKHLSGNANNGWTRAAAGGVSVGLGVKTLVGGIGLAAGGTAVGLGALPMALIGGSVALGGYGLFKLGQKSREFSI